jgi:flagellar basal-body rod protein FlgC
MGLDGIFASLDVSGSALSAQRIRMEIITKNLAYAEVDSTSEHGAYRRRVVAFHTVLDRALRRHGAGDLPYRGVSVSVREDPTPGEKVKGPNGETIEKSNVDVHQEMVGLLQASHAYEANIAAVRAFREMVQRALTIGR